MIAFYNHEVDRFHKAYGSKSQKELAPLAKWGFLSPSRLHKDEFWASYSSSLCSARDARWTTATHQLKLLLPAPRRSFLLPFSASLFPPPPQSVPAAHSHPDSAGIVDPVCVGAVIGGAF